MGSTNDWFQGYAKAGGEAMWTVDYPPKTYEYRTMEATATDQAQELLAKAEYFRLEGRPEKWSRDIERKALKKLERSFELRHMFSRHYPRPCVLPVGSYGYDAERAARRSVTPSPSDAPK